MSRLLALIALSLAAVAGGCGKPPAPPENPKPKLPSKEQRQALKPMPPPWEVKGAMPKGLKLPKDARTKKLPPVEEIDLSAIDRIPPPPPAPPVRPRDGRAPARARP
jgi:hypothetical protein